LRMKGRRAFLGTIGELLLPGEMVFQQVDLSKLMYSLFQIWNPSYTGEDLEILWSLRIDGPWPQLNKRVIFVT